MSGSSASAGPRAALDLGSSRARGMISGNDAIIDHPARVRPVADDAHHRGQPETGVSRWCCPVRHGIVIDAAGCTRLTRRLLHTADAAPALREILIGTPVAPPHTSGGPRRTPYARRPTAQYRPSRSRWPRRSAADSTSPTRARGS